MKVPNEGKTAVVFDEDVVPCCTKCGTEIILAGDTKGRIRDAYFITEHISEHLGCPLIGKNGKRRE